MSHYLDPLLRPQSIAVVGATRRVEAVGNVVLKNLLAGDYPGRLYAINPRYEEISGIPCFTSLVDLPTPVEHVIFALSDDNLEAAFDDAIAHGIKSATIFSSLVLENDSCPPLKDRIADKATQAGILICGGNGMGFYNFTDAIHACGFDTRAHNKHGNVSLISQSGAGMSGILDVDERIRFNFAVSSGQELNVTSEDFLDYALEQTETRVIGLFLETSRQPEKMIAALNKAQQKKIPVVVVKVGRTELAAKLAISHSGAMAGSDAVYEALFDRFGVQRVDDMEQLATALIMFAQPHPVHTGGIVSIHDSGGERQLLIDLADKVDVQLAQISEQTAHALEALLDPGLPAVNPLDAWSVGGPDAQQKMIDCFSCLLKDNDAALGAVVHDRAPHGKIYPEYIDFLRGGHAASGKPVFLVANRQGTGADDRVLDATYEGYPVIDGVSAFLTGARCMFNYRDFLQYPTVKPPLLANKVRAKWKTIFTSNRDIDEHLATLFLTDCGVPMMPSNIIINKDDLLSLARSLQYPLVMKTAMPGISHKSDVDGVKLNISDETNLLKNYDDLSRRLGNRVLITQMHDEAGVEMILGISRDAQFGPVVVMGIGGIYTEKLKDVICVLPPFDAGMAIRCLHRMKLRKLLDANRGRPAVDVAAFCQAAAIVSVIAVEFKEQILELDINPVKILPQGCLGLDALLSLSDAETSSIADTQAINV